MSSLRLRDGAAAASASGSSSPLSLGAIIAIVVAGTLVLATAGGLVFARISHRKRRQRRQNMVQQEAELHQKEMMAVSMLRGDTNLVPTLSAHGPAAATASTLEPVAYTALSDCGSSTCCSLASSFDTAEHEGSGFASWWRNHWRQMRSGSTTKTKPGADSFGSGAGHNCPHGHDHRTHHRRHTCAHTGPRKLQRRRPTTSIIASTNSLFFPSFGETSHNDASNHGSTQLSGIHVPGSDSISHHHNYQHPQRPPPPADDQRLLPNGNMNMRYHLQQQQQHHHHHHPQQQLRPVSLQPEPQNSRSLPRAPQPALIIPDRSHAQQMPQNAPVPRQLTDQQRHMILAQKQHLQQQMAYYQQQLSLQKQQQQQLMQEQQRRGYKSLPQNFATDSALSEILRSTEKRLQQLQAEPLSGLDTADKRQSVMSGLSGDEADSPILDAAPTPLSSPSRSPRKMSGAGVGVHSGIIPVIALPPPATSTATNSSPDTHSSVYSSSPASPVSSRSSSLSTVYSADERDALAGISDGPFASKGLAGLGITGANVPDDGDSGADDYTAASASRRSRRMSLSVNTNISAHNAHIPDPPPRSPKRSAHRSAVVSASMVMMGGGINIPHGSFQNSASSERQGSPTKRNTAIIRNNSGIRSSFGPNRYMEAAGSASDDSDSQKEDDDLLPRHATAVQGPQGPRAEPAGARRSRQEPSDALQTVEAEQALFQQSVKAVAKPQPHQQHVPQLTVGNLAAGHRNTVVAMAADLRRMNSIAYSEASSCYSNTTTATSVASGPVASGQPGSLAVPRSSAGGRGHRRRSSTNGTADAGPRASVGSRQYLALGTKHASLMALDKENRGLGAGPSQQRMSYDALTTLAQAAAASNAPPVSSAPLGARSKRAMSVAMAGTTLLRVDENPASSTSTPRGTPKKTAPYAQAETPTKANVGKPLTKSPSRGTHVGNVEPMSSSPRRKSKTLAPGTGPSTPSKSGKGLLGLRQPGSGGKGSKRDSLGLYDQDGFLMSSPFREK